MLRLRLPLMLMLFLTMACARPRPAFVEPAWGDAPPPAPEQIAEITLSRRTCRGKCRSELVVLRRDGEARREYRTGNKQDSLFFATIDSVTYLQLARRLVSDGFFAPRREGTGTPEPLSSATTIASASILCRRYVGQWDYGLKPGSAAGRNVAAIDSVARHLSWGRCCRA